jgi:hypothetical protein
MSSRLARAPRSASARALPGSFPQLLGSHIIVSASSRSVGCHASPERRLDVAMPRGASVPGSDGGLAFAIELLGGQSTRAVLHALPARCGDAMGRPQALREGSLAGRDISRGTPRPCLWLLARRMRAALAGPRRGARWRAGGAARLAVVVLKRRRWAWSEMLQRQSRWAWPCVPAHAAR